MTQLPLPLNAVAQVSELFIKRLQHKPNWRREEIVEELEGALNEWLQSKNLVAVKVPNMPPLSSEAGAWLLEALDSLKTRQYRCYEEPPPWLKELRRELDREQTRRELAASSAPVQIPPQPTPVEGVRLDGVPPKPEPTSFTTIRTSWERGDSWSFVSSLRSTVRTIYQAIRRAVRCTDTPTSSK